MREAWASAPGKVNLLLRVGEGGSDGYHPLVTVFEAVQVRELVHVRTSRSPGIRVRTFAHEGGRARPMRQFVAAPRHLAYRAAQALRPLAQANWGPSGAGVRIDVVKALPVAGGMAGGSADAAATLAALNAMWGLRLSSDQLEQVGRRLGADVPACLRGGMSLGTGRGDRLTPLAAGVGEPGQARHHMAIAVSRPGLATPAVFAEFDRSGGRRGAPSRPSSALVASLCGPEPWRDAANDLQGAALALRPELGPLARAGLRAGARGVVLAGSGPSLVGFVASREAAGRLARAWSAAPGVASCLLAWGPARGARLQPAPRVAFASEDGA